MLRSSECVIAPVFDPKRARQVLSKVDDILSQDATADRLRDVRFVELGEYLCEIRAAQHWRLENLVSFDDFLEKRFPGSRRKAYYLMAVHEHLPSKIKPSLKTIGFSKGIELTRVARADGERFDSATWVHKAAHHSKEQFKHEVEKHLSGKNIEPSEIIYFKLFRSQIPIIESALEAASRMLGSDRSRGYCLEMICADFLAGANLDQDPNTLLVSVSKLIQLLPEPQKLDLLQRLQR